MILKFYWLSLLISHVLVFHLNLTKSSLVDLESKTRNILGEREHEGRLKSRALWLLCGDDNTPFFHKYANYKKYINSIWKIADDEGNMVEGFESIAGAGVHHFESLFQEDTNLHLPEILKIADNYPSSISEEENYDLMIPITLMEI